MGKIKRRYFLCLQKDKQRKQERDLLLGHPGIDYDGFVYCAQYCFKESSVIITADRSESVSKPDGLDGRNSGPLAGLTVGGPRELIGCLLLSVTRLIRLLRQSGVRGLYFRLV